MTTPYTQTLKTTFLGIEIKALELRARGHTLAEIGKSFVDSDNPEGLSPRAVSYVLTSAVNKLVKHQNTLDAARTNILAYASLMGVADTSAKHIQKLAQKLEDALARVERGEKVTLQVLMPPQSSKSTFLAEVFLSWVLGKHPSWGLAYGTYASDFAEKRGAAIRHIVQDPKFCEVFPECELSADSNAKAEFYTTKLGGLKSVGRGGGLTGYPVKVALIDDPLKDQEEADSPVVRERLKDWYNTVVKTRQPRLTIIVSSRWHADDLTGYTLREHTSDNWEVISVPAIDEDGNSYWPERYSTEGLLAIKKGMPARQWAALYQQEPYSVVEA